MGPEVPLPLIGVLRLRYNYGNEMVEIPVEDLQLVVEENSSDITCMSGAVPVYSMPVSRTYHIEAKVVDNAHGYHEDQQYCETITPEDIDKILSSLTY